MSSEQSSDGSSAAADPAREFLEFWRRYFEQTAIQTRILFESMHGGKALEQTHSQWTQALSKSLDSFMRTPAFLEVLKQTLKQMVEVKQLQNQAVQAAMKQSGLPLAAEFASVLERIQSAEQAILKRLAAIEDRLQAVETFLRPARLERKTRRRGGD
jgi:hypothetical protein